MWKYDWWDVKSSLRIHLVHASLLLKSLKNSWVLTQINFSLLVFFPLRAQSIRSPWWLRPPLASHRVVISHSISPSHVDKPRRHLISFARFINSLPILRERLRALQSTAKPGSLEIRAVDSHSGCRGVRWKPEGHGLFEKQNTNGHTRNAKGSESSARKQARNSVAFPPRTFPGWLRRHIPRYQKNRQGEKEATTPSGNVSDFLGKAFHCCKTRIAGVPQQVCPLKQP